MSLIEKAFSWNLARPLSEFCGFYWEPFSRVHGLSFPPGPLMSLPGICFGNLWTDLFPIQVSSNQLESK